MRYFIYGLMFLILLACDTNRVFEENVDFDQQVWHKDSLASFNFVIDDEKVLYDIYTNIRNAQDYPFYNLYFQYTLKEDSLGTILKQELVNVNLFDPKTGEPYGDGLGDIFDHRHLILKKFQFDHSGPYQITFEQYMRKDELPLILSMGARVEKAQ